MADLLAELPGLSEKKPWHRERTRRGGESGEGGGSINFTYKINWVPSGWFLRQKTGFTGIKKKGKKGTKQGKAWCVLVGGISIR